MGPGVQARAHCTQRDQAQHWRDLGRSANWHSRTSKDADTSGRAINRKLLEVFPETCRPRRIEYAVPPPGDLADQNRLAAAPSDTLAACRVWISGHTRGLGRHRSGEAICGNKARDLARSEASIASVGWIAKVAAFPDLTAGSATCGTADLF